MVCAAVIGILIVLARSPTPTPLAVPTQTRFRPLSIPFTSMPTNREGIWEGVPSALSVRNAMMRGKWNPHKEDPCG